MQTRLRDFDRQFAFIDELRRHLGRSFEEDDFGLLRAGEEQLGWAGRGAWPRVNVYDVGATLVVSAELPGLSEKDVGITVHQDVLTLSGERTQQTPEGYKALRQERGPVKFARSFALPCKVDLEKTVASLVDGILTITLEKAAEAQPRQIAIRTR